MNVRKFAAVAGIVAVLGGAGLASASCGGSSGSSGTSQTPGQAWMSGQGGTDLSAVKNDLNQISQDANDGTALSTDGSQLRSDATAAVSAPPPGASATDYVGAMQYFGQAGKFLAQGDVQDAISWINDGTASMSAATDQLGS